MIERDFEHRARARRICYRRPSSVAQRWGSRLLLATFAVVALVQLVRWVFG